MNKMIVGLILIFALLGIFYLTRDTKSSDGLFNLSSSSKEDPLLFSYWKKYESKSGDFEVLVPSEPQYAKDFIDIPGSDKKKRYEIFASEKPDGTLFMISVITYPTEIDMGNTREILKNMVHELAAGKKDHKLNDLAEIEKAGKLTYHFNIENNEFKIQGETFLVNNVQYVISYIVRKENYNEAEYNHFVNSFTLLPKM
ncbi:MAG: hypothetical protein Q8K60_07290 [Parachlamydiaceae bacterium]|nr:hypothetical protein [Parachlamydiaceae bacterium]